MANGFGKEVNFEEQLDGILDELEPKQQKIMRFFYNYLWHLEDSIKQNCNNQVLCCSLERQKIIDKQEPSALLSRVYNCLPSKVQKALITFTIIYVVLSTFGAVLLVLFVRNYW